MHVVLLSPNAACRSATYHTRTDIYHLVSVAVCVLLLLLSEGVASNLRYIVTNSCDFFASCIPNNRFEGAAAVCLRIFNTVRSKS